MIIHPDMIEIFMIVMLVVELATRKKQLNILQLDDPMLIIMHPMMLCVEELGIDICIIETVHIHCQQLV